MFTCGIVAIFGVVYAESEQKKATETTTRASARLLSDLFDSILCFSPLPAGPLSSLSFSNLASGDWFREVIVMNN